MTVVAAVAFTWLGMVLAISFLEAPLKFRAPEMTVRIGLGVGRIVFRALNAVEVVLAVVALAAAVIGDADGALLVAVTVVAAILAVQLVAIRPVLNKRSDRVLAGETGPRSRVHLVYVAAEVLKVAALVIAGVLALTG